MVVQVYIYVNDVRFRLELFNDEKISVTSSVQNLNDIGKLFTDYSQSFTVPASDYNNQVLSHWYESAIDNGFDARTRKRATIEINNILFREGKMQLEKASQKNGYIESYSLTFYGNLTQLKERFKDDKLELVFDTAIGQSLNHPYTSTEVINRITQSTDYDVRYPLIGNIRKFDYQTATSTDVTTSGGAIKFNDLFPAVKINRILDMIQQKYGITFTGTFRDYNQFRYLFQYLKNAELPRGYGSGLKVDFLTKTQNPFPELDLTTDIITSNWNNFLSAQNKRLLIKYRITPNTPSLTTVYKVELFRDGILHTTFENQTGIQTFTLYDVAQIDDPNNHQFYLKVSSVGTFTFNSLLSYIRKTIFGDVTSVGNNTVGQTINNLQNLGAYCPDIKVEDWFMGIVKMFNLIVTPIDEVTFKLEPLELYYQYGKTKDLTEFIENNEVSFERPKLYKGINFTYEKSENILNNRFRELFNRDYGDLTYNNVNTDEQNNYDIKLPFENVMWEKATGFNFLTATMLNKDLQPYTPKPVLMYLSQIQTVPNSIFYNTGVGTTTSTTYARFSNEIKLAGSDLAYLSSINWGVEISPFHLVNAPRGLYQRMYEQYVANLYNQKTRIVKVKGLLNPVELSNLKLNDRIIIRDKRYIINSFTSEITSGEVSFELLNDYRELNIEGIVGYRFASVQDLYLDNTAQEIDVLAYIGVYDSLEVATNVGFANVSNSGVQLDDYIFTIQVDENLSGVERTETIKTEYTLDGVVTNVFITITQDA